MLCIKAIIIIMCCVCSIDSTFTNSTRTHTYTQHQTQKQKIQTQIEIKILKITENFLIKNIYMNKDDNTYAHKHRVENIQKLMTYHTHTSI